MATNAKKQTNENAPIDSTVQKATWVVRFQERVESIFKKEVGELKLDERQRRLIQNYAIACDQALKNAELRRWDDKKPPYSWANVDMITLSQSVINYSRMGFDPGQDNHISFIPFWDKHLNKYILNPIEGYKGKELKSRRYGIYFPNNTIFKLVYAREGEEFTPIWKDSKNNVEGYIHKAPLNPFAKGKILGGYWYMEFDDPKNNKLRVMSMDDIMKRKPDHAAPEFWGGERDKWVKKNGKNVKEGKEKVEGWLDEMCLKTLKRDAYGSIPIDSEKIDEALLHYQQMQITRAKLEAEDEIDEKANKEFVDIPEENIHTSEPAPEEAEQKIEPAELPKDPRDEKPGPSF